MPESMVTHAPPGAVSLATVPDDVSGLFAPRFPDRAVVGSVARMFPAIDDVAAGAPVSVDGQPGFGWREGVVWRLELSPGTIGVRRRDYARRERTAERRRPIDERRRGRDVDAQDARIDEINAEIEWVAAHAERAHQWAVGDALVDAGLVGPEVADGIAAQAVADFRRRDAILRRVEDTSEKTPRGRVTRWSARSRSKMTERLAQLDYAPLLALGTPAMVTLTLPDRWEWAAPSAKDAATLFRNFGKRYARTYGASMVCVWKREFQRRGAPHWHLLMVPPTHGPAFREWLSATWADVVGKAMRRNVARAGADGSWLDEEHRRHLAAGTGVDYQEGSRYLDPKRVGIYFAKHGAYAEKEYQNEPPALWVEQGTVGRYWGVQGLEAALVAVEMTPADAQRMIRTLRRWHRAQGIVTKRAAWRRQDRTSVDMTTGEVIPGFRWRRRMQTVRVKRMTNPAGFLLANDAPGLALALMRVCTGS